MAVGCGGFILGGGGCALGGSSLIPILLALALSGGGTSLLGLGG